jgi:hypothetical protein
VYNIKRKMRKFDLDTEGVEAIEEVVNNPLCIITNKQFITLERKIFNDKGKIQSSEQYIQCVLEWTEKELML